MTGLYQALVVHAAEQLTAEPYHALTLLDWQLDLNLQGVPAGELIPLTHQGPANRGRPVGTLPGAPHWFPEIVSTSNASPLIGGGKIEYVLGWASADSNIEMVERNHAAFIALHEQWADDETSDYVPRIILSFLREHLASLQKPAKWDPKQRVLITINGRNAYESPSASRFWATHVRVKKSGGQEGLCLVCGETGQLAGSLPQKVKGPLVPGGEKSGVAPISINEEVYGYGLNKGLGQVPICADCAQAIPASLNALLGDEDRSRGTSESRVTWWVSGATEIDYVGVVDQALPEKVAALLDAADRPSQYDSFVDPERFNYLSVTGNAARLVIRNWSSVPLAEVKAHVTAWFKDTEIQPDRPDGRRHHPLWLMATATGRFDATSDRYMGLGAPGGHHPHDISAELTSVALFGSRPPAGLLAHLVTRISSDRRIDDLRSALLRLILNRSTQEALMPGLDPTCTLPCYVAGRLFAHYEEIQERSALIDGGNRPNATFGDRHLAGAISDPRTALTAGDKQATAWFNRLRRNNSHYFLQRELDEIIALLDPMNPLPARASLEEQAQFVLGYHHQRAHRREEIKAAHEAKLLSGANSNDTTMPTADEQH